MHLEIHIALSYLATHLYNKLPRRRINLFTELLSSSLSNKYQGHWYPQQPQRGSAFRCLKSTDPLIKTATIEANIAYTDVIESLPKDLCLWVDPGEVSYSVGEGGATRVLWKEGDEVDFGYGGGAWSALSPVEDSAAAAAAAWMWGGAGGAPMVDAGTTLMTAASIAPPPVTLPLQQLPPAPQHQPITPTTPTAPAPATGKKPTLMTTAAFAQTKFGSTKLKSNTSRRSHNNRMSPTEFSNYIKQKQREQQQMQQLMMGGQQQWGTGAWDPWQQQPQQVQWSTAAGPSAAGQGQQPQGVVAN